MPKLVPIFIVADDDHDAAYALMKSLDQKWFYIPVFDSGLVVKYASEFATTAIFLSDAMHYPYHGGIPGLLQKLIDTVGKPVIILAEIWDPTIAEKWKNMGAHDCLPHPTRTRERTQLLRGKIRDLARVDAHPMNRVREE